MLANKEIIQSFHSMIFEQRQDLFRKLFNTFTTIEKYNLIVDLNKSNFETAKDETTVDINQIEVKPKHSDRSIRQPFTIHFQKLQKKKVTFSHFCDDDWSENTEVKTIRDKS